MRRLLILLVLACVLSALTGFLYWSKQRPSTLYLSDLRVNLSSEPRPETAVGNLLLLRPQLYPLDYQTPEHLRLVLSAALDQAAQAQLLSPATLLVLPEHIGTWLLGSHEKVEFYRARSRQEVRNWLLLGNPLLAVRVMLKHLDAERLDEALLRMKAERMAEDYQQLFSELAQTYQISILAGSILLPEPQVIDGQLRIGQGPLENISLVFSPNGLIQQATYSEIWPWQPTPHAQRFTHAGVELEVQRSWLDYYPKAQISYQQKMSPPVFLRGHLSWPIGGASRDIRLTPAGAPQWSEDAGSHLLNLWLVP